MINDRFNKEAISRAFKIIEEVNFPTLPGVMQDIQAELTKETPSVQNLTNFVSSDVALTAKVLKSVNSAFYKRANRIEHVKQAITTLGLRNFYTDVVSSAIREVIENDYLTKDQFKVFWDHSMNSAKSCRFIAEQLNKNGANIDVNQAYLTGLFHDSGIPIMVVRFPDYKEFFNISENHHFSIVETEDKRYRTNHSVICYLIGKKWHLPLPVSEAIYFHHSNDMGFYKNRVAYELSAILRLSELYLSRIFPENFFSIIHDITDEEVYDIVMNKFEISEDQLDNLCNELTVLLD